MPAYDIAQAATGEPEARIDSGLSVIPAATEPPQDDGLIDYGDVKVRPSDLGRLSLFLDEKIAQFNSGTEAYQKSLTEWREYMDPRKTQKDYPWKNAANYFMPIGRIVVDAVKSNIKETVERKQKKLFVSEITSATDVGLQEGQVHDAEMAIQEACEKFAREPGYLDLPSVLDEALDEMPVSGLAAFKLTNDSDVVPLVVATERDSEGQVTQGVKDVVFHTGPRVDVLPTETFFFPLGQYKSAREMLFVGNWLTLTPSELENRALKPWSYLYTKECASGAVQSLESMNTVTAKRQSATGQTGFVSEIRIYEVFIQGWRLYKDTQERYALRVTYCPGTRHVLKIVLTDGDCPFELEFYSKRAGSIIPRGAIEHITQLITAINTGINQTFDAQTLANSPSVTYPEDSQAADKLANGFFPGLQLPETEKGSIGILKFPDTSSVSLEMLAFFQQLIYQLTRMGPSSLGDISAGRRTPATLGLSMQQASNQLIDELIDRLRLTMGRIMGRVLVMNYKNNPDVFDEILDSDAAQLVRTVIATSIDKKRSLAEIIRLRLSGSSAARSIELERQNLLAVTQLTMAWTKMAVELMAMLFGPQAATAPPEAKMAVVALLKAQEVQLRRVVEMSDIPDAKSIVPEIGKMIEGVLQQPPLGQGAPGVGGMQGGGPTGIPVAPAAGPAMMGATPNLATMLAGAGGGGGA